jgi:hypothetical protein
MSLIKDIENHASISVVGMAKNTGKTTCLNFIIRCFGEKQKQIAVTSIGIDGEERDVLYDTPKPRITLYKGAIFITSERHYADKEFPAEMLAISNRFTPLGRLITARALDTGKVILSGPSDLEGLREMMANMSSMGVSLTLVDGAFSRMSLASPVVSEAAVLCTGAACTSQLPELVRRTKFCYRLINSEQAPESISAKLFSLGNGVWLLDKYGVEDKIASSVFTFNSEAIKFSEKDDTVYVNGAVTDSFLETLCAGKMKEVTLIVHDFSKLFIRQHTYDKFVRLGGKLQVLRKTKLIAVCTNPVSPEGVRLNPVVLREEMQRELQIPVYDIMLTGK